MSVVTNKITFIKPNCIWRSFQQILHTVTCC